MSYRMYMGLGFRVLKHALFRGVLKLGKYNSSLSSQAVVDAHVMDLNMNVRTGASAWRDVCLCKYRKHQLFLKAWLECVFVLSRYIKVLYGCLSKP